MNDHDHNGTENGGAGNAPVPPSGYRPSRLLADICGLLTSRGLRPVIKTRDLIDAVHQCEYLLELLGIPPQEPIAYEQPPELRPLGELIAPPPRSPATPPSPSPERSQRRWLRLVPGQRPPDPVELDRPDDVDELEAD